MIFDTVYLKKGIVRVVLVHIISIIITAFLTFFVPKFLSTYDYGLWQLFVFYAGYLGFFHFGWADGVYLNHIGENYSDLNKTKIVTEIFVFTIFQIFVALIIFLLSFIVSDIDKSSIVKILSLYLIVVNLRFFLIYLFQACGKVKEFSNIQIFEKVFIILFFVLYISIFKNFLSIIFADFCAKLFSLFIAFYYAIDIFKSKLTHFNIILNDIKNNIFDGSKLMIANIASMFTTGIIKLGIEHNYGIIEFGKVSLALTFSNLCVNIFNSMGIVFIPLIKNTSNKVTSSLYDNLHVMINFFTFFVMIFYFPIKNIATSFLPNYYDSFTYLSITFPLMYFCCLQALLLTTYLKALREEKRMMNANNFTICFAIIYTFVSIYIVKSFTMCVLGLSLVYFVKVSLYEYIITKKIQSTLFLKFLIESIIMCFGFSICNYFIKGLIGMIIYIAMFIIYLIVNNDIFSRFKKIYNYLK